MRDSDLDQVWIAYQLKWSAILSIYSNETLYSRINGTETFVWTFARNFWNLSAGEFQSQMEKYTSFLNMMPQIKV